MRRFASRGEEQAARQHAGACGAGGASGCQIADEGRGVGLLTEAQAQRRYFFLRRRTKTIGPPWSLVPFTSTAYVPLPSCPSITGYSASIPVRFAAPLATESKIQSVP